MTDKGRDGSLSDEDFSRVALDHAWGWFSMHAAQRMQVVGFFFVGVAFLTSAYTFALNADRPEASAVIAVAGALVAFLFRRLDIRTRELVKAGEAAMRESEKRLKNVTGIAEIELVDAVETPQTPFTSYGQVIAALQWAACGAFLVAALVATSLALEDAGFWTYACRSWLTCDDPASSAGVVAHSSVEDFNLVFAGGDRLAQLTRVATEVVPQLRDG